MSFHLPQLSSSTVYVKIPDQMKAMKAASLGIFLNVYVYTFKFIHCFNISGQWLNCSPSWTVLPDSVAPGLPESPDYWIRSHIRGQARGWA